MWLPSDRCALAQLDTAAALGDQSRSLSVELERLKGQSTDRRTVDGNLAVEPGKHCRSDFGVGGRYARVVSHCISDSPDMRLGEIRARRREALHRYDRTEQALPQEGSYSRDQSRSRHTRRRGPGCRPSVLRSWSSDA